MKRIPKLIALKDSGKGPHAPHAPHIVFVYINEAHSDRWPLGGSHPPVQASYQERLQKAREFAESFPYTVLVDAWDDQFEKTYHAWPDQFVRISNSNSQILDKSRYDESAHLINDYSDLLSA